MRDLAELTDDELLDELAVADDPQELVVLRAEAAQRGLWSAARSMTPAERREKAEREGGVR